MTQKHKIMVVGGGYAGINLLKGFQKEFGPDLGNKIEIIFIDKQAYHFKKVKLFKAIVEEKDENLKIPFSKYCRPGIKFVQGELKAVHQNIKRIEVMEASGIVKQLEYDRLILALGSVLREVESHYGGKSLNNLQSAKVIRQELLNYIHSEKSKVKAAIVGAGITGIETAAELVEWLRTEAILDGKEPSHIEVILINSKNRLLPELPEKYSWQLEQRLRLLGVACIHRAKATQFNERILQLNNGTQLEVDYCIWTIGVSPHPSLQQLGLPLLENGKLETDSWYRLKNDETIYAIGDCAHVLDPGSGVISGMTCKEAINHAKRLASIIKGDIQGIQTEGHKYLPEVYCIGLGPKEAFTWVPKWGIDFVFTGKLGLKIREYTWDYASLL